MSRPYPFFPRGTLLQDGSNSTEYLSETYDLQGENNMLLEMRPFAVAGTSPSISIDFQTTNTLHANDADWTDDLSFAAVTAGGGTPVRVNVPASSGVMGKFGRVKVTLTGDGVGFTFEVLGIGRSG